MSCIVLTTMSFKCPLFFVGSTGSTVLVSLWIMMIDVEAWTRKFNTLQYHRAVAVPVQLLLGVWSLWLQLCILVLSLRIPKHTQNKYKLIVVLQQLLSYCLFSNHLCIVLVLHQPTIGNCHVSEPFTWHCYIISFHIYFIHSSFQECVVLIQWNRTDIKLANKWSAPERLSRISQYVVFVQCTVWASCRQVSDGLQMIEREAIFFVSIFGCTSSPICCIDWCWRLTNTEPFVV